MTIATAASLFTFVLEWVLHKKFHERLFSKEGDGVTAPAEKSSDVEAPPTSTEAVSNSACCPIDNKARLRTLQNTVISYTFEAGIIFHSKFARLCLLVPCSIGSHTSFLNSVGVAITNKLVSDFDVA